MNESQVELSANVSDAHTANPPSETAQTYTSHAANLAIITLAVIALFWRVFFLGETVIDVNTLNNQLPWGYSAGQSDYPYNRRDLTDTYVTRDYFVASAYRAGEFPLWNPYTMAGHPIYADGVTRTLSPFLLFYKFFDIPLGYSLARLFELLLAAVFMYIFLVVIGVSGSGALMGSMVFGFSAHSLLHLTGLGWWGGLMWFPVILLFVDRAIRRDSYTYAMLAGVCLAAQFFCGYLPNQIYYLGAVALYYLFYAYLMRRDGVAHSPVRRLLLMMLVTLVVGLTLSATQWVPSLELLSYSNRRIVGTELGYIYLPPWYAATLVFPNLFGSAYDAKTLKLFTALGVSHDHILYIGIAGLAMLSLSLYWLRQTRKESTSRELVALDKPARRRVVFFVLLGVLSLVLMMSAPLYVYLTRFIPILQVIRVAVRAGVLFLFAAAVLVAFGTDLLLRSSDLVQRFNRLLVRFILAAAGFVIAAIASSYLLRLIGLTVNDAERGRLAFIRRSVLALSAQFAPLDLDIVIPLALLSVVSILLWAFVGRRITAKTLLVAMFSLLVVDLFWNGKQFDHSFDRSRVFPRTEMTDLLHSLPLGRVLVVPSDLETNRTTFAGSGDKKIIAPPNTLLPYQISTVTGKNQQFPKWYREFASLIEPQPNPSHVVFDEGRSPFLDLLNVRYVMTHESNDPFLGYDLIATSEGVSLYENKDAMPRAFFAKDTVEVQSHSEALATLSAAGFDPHTTVVIERPTVSAADSGLDSRRNAALKAAGALDATREYSALYGQTQLLIAAPITAIIEDTRNRVAIQTDNGAEGLLVLSDNFYPGWRAFVDNVPAEIIRANCTMRAVNVPAGRHLVSFVFTPAAFFASMYVSLAAAAITLVLLIASAGRRKRRIITANQAVV